MTNAIDTVIFDLDGTLVDSQPAALGGTIEALSRFGVQVTATDLRKVFGGGAWKLVGHFLERDLGSDRARDLLRRSSCGAACSWNSPTKWSCCRT